MAEETDGQEDDETTNRIFQPEIELTLTDKKDREFFPWHKPRKHYLRIHQWCAEIQSLIRVNRYEEGDVIRYLGFPGEDFLDLRVLAGVCARTKLKVRYLGFDRTASYSGRESQFNLSKHEVFQLGCVHSPSYVLKDDFCVLAKVNSIAYRETTKFRDFDIINIDLCDSMASSSEVAYHPYFEAIKQLCDIQVRGRTRPWILFLTTRAIRDQIDTRTKRKLFNCVVDNIKDHESFASSLAESLALNDDDIRNEISDAEQLEHSSLVSLFGLSIGKWLLKMMMEANTMPRVRLLKSYSYRVEIDEPDMLSLAFIFEPHVTPPVDKTGLTPTAKKADPHPGEEKLAIDLLSAFCAIEDIDQKLHDDSATHQKMIDKCADLLETVHYDKDSYKKWVEKNRWTPSQSGRK